jgi:tetratricopeptide (TPR) repeat protein
MDHLNLGPYIVNDLGDRYLYPVNRDTFKRVASHDLFQKQFGEGFFKTKTLHVVIGSDSGLLLNYLLNHGVPEGSRYLFVELPQVLNYLENEGAMQELPDCVICVAPHDFLIHLTKFQITNYLYTECVKIWRSLACIDSFLHEYQELLSLVRNEIEKVSWRTSIELGSKVFIQRQLENLADNRTSASCLKNLFPGKTAVLLAGGPSLDDILPWVKENREELVILAVSRIARRLQQVKLAPDIFFSVDPHAVSFDVSKEMLNFWDRTLFINQYHVYPPLLSQWQGRSLFIGPRFPWAEADSDNYLYGPGPTVTNSAFSVAVEMGFSQIILAGVDLCFGPDGQSHAQGSNESSIGPQFRHFDTEVETNDGSKAFTQRAMAEAIPSLASQATQAIQAGCKTINPAAKAARIANVAFQPLSEITFEPLSEPASITLQKVLPEDDRPARLRHYKNILQKLTTANRQIQTIRKLATEGLKCNDGLFGRNGLKADFKYKKRMDKVENALNRPSIAPYSKLVKEYGLRQFVGIVRPDTDQEWSDEQIEETGRIYYEAFRDGSKLLRDLITMAIHRVEIRIDEENFGTAPQKLIQSWHKLGEPGRVRLWRKRHDLDLNQCPQNLVLEIHKLEEQFDSLIVNNDTGHFRRSCQDSDPALARSKANTLFKNRDHASLTGLAGGLETMDVAAALPVLHLTKGYLAELDKNLPDALEYYQRVLDTEAELAKEDALRRIAALSLDLCDEPNALLAFECLAALSPIYLPQYAELARLLGQTRTALNAYADYLDKFPDNPEILLKVGKIYKDIHQDESAKKVFEYLLKINPDNTGVRQLLDEVTV